MSKTEGGLIVAIMILFYFILFYYYYCRRRDLEIPEGMITGVVVIRYLGSSGGTE